MTSPHVNGPTGQAADGSHLGHPSPGPHQAQASYAGQQPPVQPTWGAAPPVRSARSPARWLILVTTVSLVLGVGGLLLQLLYALDVSLLREELVELGVALVALLAAPVSVAAWIAGLVLAIIVTSRGRGRLREGGIVLMLAGVAGSLLGVELSGNLDMVPQAVQVAVTSLEVGVGLLTAVLRIAGILLLLAGLRALPSAGAARP